MMMDNEAMMAYLYDHRQAIREIQESECQATGVGYDC